jgi:hypothetical protein
LGARRDDGAEGLEQSGREDPRRAHAEATGVSLKDLDPVADVEVQGAGLRHAGAEVAGGDASRVDLRRHEATAARQGFAASEEAFDRPLLPGRELDRGRR